MKSIPGHTGMLQSMQRVEKCKNLRAIGFTVVNESGSKEVLV